MLFPEGFVFIFPDFSFNLGLMVVIIRKGIMNLRGKKLREFFHDVFNGETDFVPFDNRPDGNACP